MNLKNILKNTGKTAATIVCPPVGLALWPKKTRDRIMAGFVGVVLSAASSIGIGIGAVCKIKQIYDNPQIEIGPNIKSASRAVIETPTCPIALYFDSQTNTILRDSENPERKYSVTGGDVVTFKDGKYHLNFGPERLFGISALPGVSLERVQNQVKIYENELRGYVDKGDFFNSRKVRRNLDMAKTDLEDITKDYNETRQKFQEAVDKMNSELENLAVGIPNQSQDKSTQGEQK